MAIESSITQPNSMILVSFSSAEDYFIWCCKKIMAHFRSQGTENPPFRSFFWDTRYIQGVDCWEETFLAFSHRELVGYWGDFCLLVDGEGVGGWGGGGALMKNEKKANICLEYAGCTNMQDHFLSPPSSPMYPIFSIAPCLQGACHSPFLFSHSQRQLKRIEPVHFWGDGGGGDRTFWSVLPASSPAMKTWLSWRGGGGVGLVYFYFCPRAQNYNIVPSIGIGVRDL